MDLEVQSAAPAALMRPVMLSSWMWKEPGRLVPLQSSRPRPVVLTYSAAFVPSMVPGASASSGSAAGRSGWRAT